MTEDLAVTEQDTTEREQVEQELVAAKETAEKSQSCQE